MQKTEIETPLPALMNTARTNAPCLKRTDLKQRFLTTNVHISKDKSSTLPISRGFNREFIEYFQDRENANVTPRIIQRKPSDENTDNDDRYPPIEFMPKACPNFTCNFLELDLDNIQQVSDLVPMYKSIYPETEEKTVLELEPDVPMAAFDLSDIEDC